jgi:rubrerythrin
MDKALLGKVFRQAIKKEEGMVKVYLGWSKQADDPEMRKLFRALADDEAAHAKRLKYVFRSLG